MAVFLCSYTLRCHVGSFDPQNRRWRQLIPQKRKRKQQIPFVGTVLLGAATRLQRSLSTQGKAVPWVPGKTGRPRRAGSRAHTPRLGLCPRSPPTASQRQNPAAAPWLLP